MNTPSLQSNAAVFAPDPLGTPNSEHSHGVSWPAIFAGATGAAVISLVLILLGTGIGFSAVSPWGDQGVSSTTVGVSTIVWITVVQILASLLGGYLAGRLRAKWVSIHSHETYFRDTAHGFLAWAVGTLITATLLSSTISSVVGGGLKAGASVAGGAATIAGTGAAGVAAGASGSSASSSSSSDLMGYLTDSLFRPGNGQSPGMPGASTTSSPTAEVGRIFSTSLKNGSMSPADSAFLAQLISQRTGISADDAQKRVNDTFAQAQQTIEEAKAQAKAAADAARKATAAFALWLVVSMLIGAFTASWAATFGGRLRDGVDTGTTVTH
jgi:hypothetical protein